MNPSLHIPHPQPGEELVFVLRRHSFTFLKHLIPFVLLAVAPLIVFILVSELVTRLLAERDPGGVVLVMAASLYYLFLGLRLFHSWLVYYLDAWIVTTKRIINITQHSLFSRVVSEVPLAHIQDVTVEVHGLLPTMLHFGDVHIQTAGELPRFLFDDVPHPQEVCQKLLEVHHQALVAFNQEKAVAASQPHPDHGVDSVA